MTTSQIPVRAASRADVRDLSLESVDADAENGRALGVILALALFGTFWCCAGLALGLLADKFVYAAAH